MISNHIIVLMQAEVERFHAGTTLLHDYHHIKTQEVAYEDTVVLVSGPFPPPHNLFSGSRCVGCVLFIIYLWIFHFDRESGSNLVGPRFACDCCLS